MPDPLITPGAVWRLLILDRDVADPKWLLVVVLDPADVRSASGETDPEVIAAWVTSRTGAARLDPLPGALAWRVGP